MATTILIPNVSRGGIKILLSRLTFILNHDRHIAPERESLNDLWGNDWDQDWTQDWNNDESPWDQGWDQNWDKN